MTDWQPISTAPRDGTRVLLYPQSMVAVWDRGAKNWRIFVIPLDGPDKIAIDWEKRPPMFYEVTLGCYGADYHPTHWMPLPPPPNEGETR